MSQEQGYPTLSDIITYLAAEGVEEITDGNTNFRQELLQHLWSLLNRTSWAGGLGVYCPSPTTFNVRSGSYLYKGTPKTFTTGSAINPTDNDTTYIWMTPSNTIASAVDATGWPTTEHIKLASIVVDASGVITSVTDLRGQAFASYVGNLTKTIEAHTAGDTLTVAESGSIHTNLGATGAITLILPASAAGTEFTFAVQAAQELRIDPGTATIRDDSGQTADKYKSADAIGECITLVADANGDWVTIAKSGTWTEEA